MHRNRTSRKDISIIGQEKKKFAQRKVVRIIGNEKLEKGAEWWYACIIKKKESGLLLELRNEMSSLIYDEIFQIHQSESSCLFYTIMIYVEVA